MSEQTISFCRVKDIEDGLLHVYLFQSPYKDGSMEVVEQLSVQELIAKSSPADSPKCPFRRNVEYNGFIFELEMTKSDVWMAFGCDRIENIGP